MQDSALVRGDLHVADEGWVAPDGQRVVWEAAGADDLPVVGAPAQTGDLGPGVDAVDPSARRGVPEVDVTIVGATTSGEEVVLPRGPGQRLDGCVMVGLLELGSGE